MIDSPSVFPKHCGWKQNLAVWSMGRWHYYNVDYTEPMPLSTQSIVDFGAQTAGARDALTELTVFDVDEHQLLQLRFFPLDDVEARLWLTRSQGKFTARGLHAEVSLMTRGVDPYFETTEFNILGRDRNAFFEVRNVGDYTLAQGRLQFWGHKYILRPLQNIVEKLDATGVIRPYVQEGQSLVPLHTSYTSAEGRQS